MTHSNSAVLRICRRLVHLFSFLVPITDRANWRREWEAEVVCRWKAINAWSSLKLWHEFGLLWRCAGAFFDALWLRKDSRELLPNLGRTLGNTEPRTSLSTILRQDFVVALRGWRKDWTTAAIAVATLAAGVGASTAVFSIVNAVLLESLPFKNPERLVEIETIRGSESGAVSFREIEDIRQQSRVFEAIGGYVPGAQYSVAGNASPEKAQAILITYNLFDVLGVPLLYGESFPAEYDRARFDAVILSHSLWKRQYGGNLSVIGRPLPIDASPYRTPAYSAFGVLPEGFDFPKHTDLYRSFFINSAFPNVQSRNTRNVVAIARLAQNIEVATAASEMAAFGDRLAEAYPDSNRGVQFVVRPLRDIYVGGIRPYLLMLTGAVTLVLIVACANVSNLLLSRALVRQQELAIRTALGAARWRLIQQMLVETLTLSLLGGAVGVFASYWALALLSRAAHFDLPSWMRIEVDGRVLVFGGIVSVAAGLVSGTSVVLTRSARHTADVIRSGRGAGVSRGDNRLRHILAISEIAVSLVLLVGAGLMIRTAASLLRADLGFSTQNLVTFRVGLPVTYPTAKVREFHRTVLANLESIPGIQAAALNSNMPLMQVGQPDRSLVSAEGQTADEALNNPYVNYQYISPGYFRTMGIPILHGREIGVEDSENNQRVAVVSSRLAQRLWPGQDAIGKRIRQSAANNAAMAGAWMTVVGVSGDVKHDAITADFAFDVYMSAAQNPQLWTHYVVRTTVARASIAAQAREAAWAVDRSQPVFDFQSMTETLRNAAWQQRVSSLVFTAFGIIAVVLAAGGLYGVMSCLVRQRRRDIGLSVALGAQPRDILKQVFRQAFKLSAAGIAIGLAGALLLARLMVSLLHGVSSNDPLVFASVFVLMAAVTVAATFFPARAAMRIDPLAALRDG
jgi:putative ABC transport system permease protein